MKPINSPFIFMASRLLLFMTMTYKKLNNDSSIFFLSFWIFFALFFGSPVFAQNKCAKIFKTNSQGGYAYGLFPETAPSKTFIFGHYRSEFIGKSIEKILRHLPEETRVIRLTDLEAHYTTQEALKRDKELQSFQEALNGREIETINTDVFGNVWIRDWVPQYVRNKDGSLKVALFNYDVGNNKMASEYFAKAMKMKLPEHNIFGEMGNVMIDSSGRLFLTDIILQQNKELSREQIKTHLKKLFVSKEVHILPRTGHTATNHIDLIAKYVGFHNGKETVLVSSSTVPLIKISLNHIARTFKDLGFHVIRVEEYDHGTKNRDPFGFINSFIFNDLVFMPTFSQGVREFLKTGERHPHFSMENVDLKQLERMEQKAKDTYEKLGFQVIPIDAFQASKRKGSVHCYTCSLIGTH